MFCEPYQLRLTPSSEAGIPILDHPDFSKRVFSVKNFSARLARSLMMLAHLKNFYHPPLRKGGGGVMIASHKRSQFVCLFRESRRKPVKSALFQKLWRSHLRIGMLLRFCGFLYLHEFCRMLKIRYYIVQRSAYCCVWRNEGGGGVLPPFWTETLPCLHASQVLL